MEEIILKSTYSAQFTTADEDATFIQHTSIEMQHVVDINGYKILCQISLGGKIREVLKKYCKQKYLKTAKN